jgi:hypothetical protein
MVLTLLAYALSPILAMKLPSRYLLSLFNLPVYVLWKLQLSSNKKPAEWVRTSREHRRERIAGQTPPQNLREAVRRIAGSYANSRTIDFKIQGLSRRWPDHPRGPRL